MVKGAGLSSQADHRIAIERATVSTDGYGGEVETWTVLCRPWARIGYGRGEERRTAAQESATLAATFRIRANAVTAAVTTRDRIMFDGAAWDIASNVPFEREARDLTATRRA